MSTEFLDEFEKAKSLRLSGFFKESLAIINELLLNHDLTERTLYIACLNEKCQCLWRMAQYDLAEEIAHQTIALTRDKPEMKQEYASAIHNLAIINRKRGNLTKAEQYHLQALAMRREIGDLTDLAISLNNLAIVYLTRGELNRAEEMFNENLAINKMTNNQRGICAVLANIADVYRRRGELTRAADLYKQALKMEYEINHPEYICEGLKNLGIIALKQGNPVEAERHLLESIKFGHQIANLHFIIESKYWLIIAFLMQHNIERASTELNTLEQLAKEKTLPEIRIRYLLAAGKVKLHQFELQSALTYAKDGKDLAVQISMSELIIESLQLLVQIQLHFFLISKDPHYKNELLIYLQELAERSKNDYIYEVYIQTLMIEGFLKRASLEINDALMKFELAELTAVEKGFGPLATEIREEIAQLTQQYQLLQTILNKNPHEVREKELSHFIAYLTDIQVLVDKGKKP